MKNKIGGIVVIASCLIFLAGNIIGTIKDRNEIGHWNLNRSVLSNLVSRYYSFSTSKHYYFKTQTTTVIPYPSTGGETISYEEIYRRRAKIVEWLRVADFLLLGIGLAMAILYFFTRKGRVVLICFFGIIACFILLASYEEYSSVWLDIFRADYLPSSWSSSSNSVYDNWMQKSIFPRIVYLSLAIYSIFGVLSRREKVY